MAVNPLEAMADAIMTYEGWRPSNKGYRLRNPGNLRESSLAIGKDARGFCVFKDFMAGYNALLEELKNKCTGRTKTGLGPNSTLLQFFQIYAPSSDHNHPRDYAGFVALWIGQSVGRNITVDTKLSEVYSEVK